MKTKELYLIYLTTPPKLHFLIRNYGFMNFLENSLKIAVKNDTFIRSLDDIILGEEEKQDEVIFYSQIKNPYGKKVKKEWRIRKEKIKEKKKMRGGGEGRKAFGG